MKDYNKYNFEGNLYGKSKLALALVKKYLTDHPNTTYDQLKVVFPDKLQPKFGFIRPIEEAKEKCKKYKRFYIDGEYILTTGDDIEIAVSREFGIDNINMIIETAKKLHYSINIAA